MNYKYNSRCDICECLNCQIYLIVVFVHLLYLPVVTAYLKEYHYEFHVIGIFRKIIPNFDHIYLSNLESRFKNKHNM